MRVSFRLNDQPVEVDVAADDLLVDVIRGLGLTGTKQACGVGVCGVCTVLVNEVPVASCLYLAPLADDMDVWTVEGVVRREPELLDAFVAHEGMQCGICTPGQVVSACALKRELPLADDRQVREYMAGNLCRCTGYESILDSVRSYLADR